MQELGPNASGPYSSLDVNGESGQVSRKDKEKIQELFKKYKGHIYKAYSEDPQLFRAIVRLWAHTGIPSNGDEFLTDEQAKEIFPLFEKEDRFDLSKFPKLSGKCLKYLPKQTYQITLSKNTGYGHLKYLPRLEELRILLIYNPLSGAEIDLNHLYDTQLIRLQMVCPSESLPLKSVLPKTLEILELEQGQLSDEHLSEYLSVAGKLEFLYLKSIPNLTAKAFTTLSPEIRSVKVLNCPQVDKKNFKALTSKVRDVCHLTITEINYLNSFLPMKE